MTEFLIWKTTRTILWICILIRSTALYSMEPNFHVIESDGKVSEVYFYGPAEWLSSPGEKLGRFPDLKKITLACGKIGIPEMKYLATVRSVESISTFAISEDAVEFSTGSLNELRAMTWLRDLDIYQNQLPEHEWQFLSNLQMLESLALDCNDGLRHVEGLTSLEYLYLFRDEFEDAAVPMPLPSVIRTLPNLKHLTVSSHSNFPWPLPDESLSLLSTFPKLRSLDLKRVSESGLPIIGKLVNLEYLTLSSVARNADITSLRSLKNLRELNLNLEALGTTDLRFLSGFTELKSLTLHCSEPFNDAVRNIPFEQIHKLERIYIWTTIERDVLIKMSNLNNLHDLSVRSLGEATEDIKADLLRNGVDLWVNHQRQK
jgi:hypothetical protein